MTSHRPRLEKWYADVITDDGCVLIVYHAALALPPLPALHLAEVLGTTRDGAPFDQVTHAPAPAPRWDGTRMHLHEPRLRLTGTWSALAPPITQRLLETADGCIDWACLLPAARVDATAGGRRFTGIGYAERLTMTMAPWTIPIDVLRWGRCHLGSETLVWIDWQGPVPARWCFRDGHPVEAPEIADDRILLEGARPLELDRRTTVRDATLGPMLPGRIPGLRALPLSRMLAGHETRWVSRATMGEVSGWALHERVEWPR